MHSQMMAALREQVLLKDEVSERSTVFHWMAPLSWAYEHHELDSVRGCGWIWEELGDECGLNVIKMLFIHI